MMGSKAGNVGLFGLADSIVSNIANAGHARNQDIRVNEIRSLLERGGEEALGGRTVYEGQTTSTSGGGYAPDNFLQSLGIMPRTRIPEITSTIIPAGAAVDESKSYMGVNEISRQGQSGLDDLLRSAQQRQRQGMGMLEGLGDQAIADARETGRAAAGADMIDLGNRGFSGSLLSSSNIANRRETGAEVRRIEDDVRRHRTGLFQDLSGDVQNIQAANVGGRAAFQAMPGELQRSTDRDVASFLSGVNVQGPGQTMFGDLAMLMSGMPTASSGQKKSWNASVFGTGGGGGCVDGNAEIRMADGGTKRLCDIEIGDKVQAADGVTRTVLDIDVGRLSPQYRTEPHVKIETANRSLVVTELHPIGGKQAKDWSVGETIPVDGLDGEKITAVSKHDYVESGDLMLEEDRQYLANDIPVTSVLSLAKNLLSSDRDMTRFMTMPLAMVDAIGDEIQSQQRYWGHSLNIRHDKGLASLEAEILAITLDEARQLANDVLKDRDAEQDAEFMKEGHTSAVFTSESGECVLNVARDGSSAARDLNASFERMRDVRYLDAEAVVDVFDIVTGVHPVAVCEHKKDTFELGSADGRVCVVVRFNGLMEPEVTWFTEDESRIILDRIAEIEETINISVNINHGDVVIRSDGEIIIVACNDPEKVEAEVA